MKLVRIEFVVTFSLILLFFVHFYHATESDSNGAASSTIKNENGTDTKKVEDENFKEKESLLKKKEKNLEQPTLKNEERKGEDLHVEECDPSNRCDDDKSEFFACLRVSGEDSLDLSLLIQNNGKGSLDVNITAPDSVSLERNIVQVKAKDKEEVRVTVADGGNDTIIVLEAGEGSCNLDFQNMLSTPIKKSETSSQPGLLGHLTLLSALMLIIIVASILIGLAWSFIRYRKIRSPKHQQLDLGLPLSTGGKKYSSAVDGWENSWDDNWDDEEAPKTPSKPVLTPSSKGLASRKFNKDGWKG